MGYGGTKTEMARLVKESGILGEAGKDLTAKNLDEKVSFDQMIEAIHKVQENMGITGTTSKEAASTIEGSVGSMKASWSNLLTALANDNKDLGKSVNEFVDSTVTAGKNLVPRIKTIVEGIKKLIQSLTKDVFPKLKKEIPELAPLIDVFQWFVTHKTVVVTATKAMITAFAINKVAQFTKTISDGGKQLLLLATATSTTTAATNLNTTAEVANTGAKVAGTTATNALTVATNLLNAAWKSNPIGLVVAGITTLITVMSLMKGKTDEAAEAEKAHAKALEEQTDKINRNKEAWDSLKESQQNQINTGMSEIAHLESLYDELTELTDINGKVKEGYEKRASFILSTLNEALGTEYTMTGNIISKYGELQKTIDSVMEKKKAQIILDSQESLYAEAINKQQEALKELDTLEEQISENKHLRASDEFLLEDAKASWAKAATVEQKNYYAALAVSIENRLKKSDEELETLENNYNEQKSLLSEYAYNIGIYESNMAAAHADEYDKMITVNWNYVKDFKDAEDAKKAMLEDQIRVTETQLKLLKELQDKSGSDIYDSQIKAAEKQLKEHKEALTQYEKYTKLGLDATKVVWTDGLDKILSEITGANIEFKEDGKGNIDMYIDGVKQGDTKSKEEMAKLVSDTLKEVSKQDKDAKTAGENLIEGVNNGIKNQDKQTSVFKSIANFGSTLLSKLKASLKEKSPSKATNEMGQYLLEGLGLGMEKEEDSILKQASDFGKSVLNALNGGLAEDVDTSAISKIKNNIPKYNMVKQQNTSSYNKEQETLNIVDAFKKALSEMKIELDDEVAAHFVERTVANAIYN